MVKVPRHPFIDFERRPDFEGEREARRRFAEPPRASPLLQRGYKTTSRASPVDLTNVETALYNQLRANGSIASHKGKLTAPRVRQAISEAKAKLKAQAAFSRAARAAKPSGADRRKFTFTPGPKTFYGTFAKIVPKASGRFRFVLPANVVPCVARATRREVLFAKNLSGKGGKSRRRRRSPHSHIGC